MDFHPADIPPPTEIRTDRLRLRPLRSSDVVLDYDAVMASREQLRAWSHSTWPSDDFTLAGNLADLERHEREHNEGIAFTYTVLDPTESRCLGCVYITPIPDSASHLHASTGYGAKVTFWIRSDALDSDLENHLLTALRHWFAAEWPFDRVVYTISQQNPRQAELLNSAGLVQQAVISLADGRRCWVYAEEGDLRI